MAGRIKVWSGEGKPVIWSRSSVKKKAPNAFKQIKDIKDKEPDKKSDEKNGKEDAKEKETFMKRVRRKPSKSRD